MSTTDQPRQPELKAELLPPEEHLSECMLRLYPGPDAYCTCRDTSPEWTI